MKPFDGFFSSSVKRPSVIPQWVPFIRPSPAPTQACCSSGGQTWEILKSPSVSFGPVWISAGSSASENRCDCTMILMSFVERAHSKLAQQGREQGRDKVRGREIERERERECAPNVLGIPAKLCILPASKKREESFFSLNCKMFLYFRDKFYGQLPDEFLPFSPLPETPSGVGVGVGIKRKDAHKPGNRLRQIELARGIFTDSSFRQACHYGSVYWDKCGGWSWEAS